MPTTLDAALDLAGKGFSVFPLDINSKLPLLEGNWRKIATRDPERIKSLWTCPVFDVPMDYNIGVALDAQTLVVDIDTRDGKQGRESLDYVEAINDPLPPTFTVRTPSGGEHRYFKTDRDSGTFPKELAKHIDLKGEGGYVVGPGSVIDGSAYEARGAGEAGDVALAPGWLRDLPAARRPYTRERAGTDGLAPLGDLDTDSAISRAIAYLKAAPDHGTYRHAARVKDFGVSQETCLALMLEHWPGADSRDEPHIAFRVENAYRYGQNAVGVASPEAEFEAVPTSSPKRGKLWIEWWHDTTPDLDQPYLIDDVLDLGAMAVTYGDSNVGKTYVVLDQARCVAAGVDWNGHKVKKGLVVYVAAEGGRGFRKRIAAFRKHHGIDKLPFALVPCPIDLHATPGDSRALIDLVKEAEAAAGEPCVLIVVDTLARAMGAGDENTSVDMGLLVRHCDRLRAATGATVNLIHHTGKDKARGARGSSALRAATDTEIEIDNGVVSVQKQRDMARAEPMHFQLTGVAIGQRADGREVTACVVEWVAASEFENRISPAAAELMAVIEEIVAARADTGEGDGSVDWTDWQDAALLVMKGHRGKPIKRTALFPLRKELHDIGAVVKGAGATWRLKADNSDKN